MSEFCTSKVPLLEVKVVDLRWWYFALSGSSEWKHQAETSSGNAKWEQQGGASKGERASGSGPVGAGEWDRASGSSEWDRGAASGSENAKWECQIKASSESVTWERHMRH